MTRSQRSSRLTAAASLLGSVAGFAFLCVVFGITADTLSTNWPLSLTGVITSIVIAACAVSGTVRVAAGIIAAYVLVFLVLAPLSQIQHREFPHLVTPRFTGSLAFPHQVQSAENLIAVGVVVFLVAYIAVSSHRPEGVRVAAHDSGRSIVRGRVELVVLALPLIAVLGAVLLGPSYFVSFRDVQTSLRGSLVGDAGKAVSGTVDAFLTVPALVCLLACIAILRACRGHDRTRTALFLGMAIAANLILNFPLSASRAWLSTFIVSCSLVALARTHGRPHVVVRCLPLLVVVGTLLVFPRLDFFRNAVGSPTDDLTVERQLVLNGDYDSFAQVTNGLGFVEQNGSTHGQQLLGTVLFAVPSTAWESKPVSTGELLGGEVVHNGYNNLSAPLWTEGYVDFGFGGMCGFLMLLGVLCAWLDGFLASRSPWTLGFVAAAFVVGYLPIMVRGALLPAMPRAMAATLVIWALSRARGPRRDVQPDSGSAPEQLSSAVGSS